MLAGEARFVSLAEIIRSRPVSFQGPAAAEVPVADLRPPPELRTSPPSPQPASEPRPAAAATLRAAEPAGPEAAAAVREARLFRAALADTFDALAVDLVRALAGDVLGRELRLGAIDIEAIARRLIAERHADEPLSVRVSPADAHIVCELPVVADPHLGPGDAVLVCRHGEIDARLTVRFAHVIAAVTP